MTDDAAQQAVTNGQMTQGLGPEPARPLSAWDLLGVAERDIGDLLAAIVARHFPQDIAAFLSAKLAPPKAKFDPFTGQPL